MELNEIISVVCEVLNDTYGLEYNYEINDEIGNASFESHLVLANLNDRNATLCLDIGPCCCVMSVYFDYVRKDVLSSDAEALSLLQLINAFNSQSISKASINDDNVFQLDMTILDISSREGLIKCLKIAIDELITDDNEVILKEIDKYLEK